MTMPTDILDERNLRKAWLKQHFSSFEYHQSLLSLHAQWLDLIRRALARAREADKARGGVSNETDVYTTRVFQGPKVRETAAEHFERVYLPLIEKFPREGQIQRSVWEKHKSTIAVPAIQDYNRYLFSETGDQAFVWMTPNERAQLEEIWGRMNEMATNIRRTVQDTWGRMNDDILLNERYTGPIDWPANWKQEVLGTEGAQLSQHNLLQVGAGKPVPLAGTYVALDPRDRRFTVNAGDILPDLQSSYGSTVWQRIGD